MVILKNWSFGRFRHMGGRNAFILVVCHGLLTCAISIDLTLTGLTGWQLAPDKALATLPFALITVAGAVSTLFVSHLLQWIGRQLGFALGSVVGAFGRLLSVWAVFNHDFWVFCLGTTAVGVYQAFAQYYRLAAADSVDTTYKSRAISIVLTGGVIAAVVGPALAAWSKDFFETGLFAGAYLMVVVLSLASAVLLLAFYRNGEANPAASIEVEPLAARPTSVILQQPIFVASAANNIVGAVAMMFVMTAAPLAPWHAITRSTMEPALFSGTWSACTRRPSSPGFSSAVSVCRRSCSQAWCST
jgi:hypothetical protein